MTQIVTTLAPAAPRRPQKSNSTFYAAVAAVPADRARAIRAALETGNVQTVCDVLGIPAAAQAIRGS